MPTLKLKRREKKESKLEDVKADKKILTASEEVA